MGEAGRKAKPLAGEGDNDVLTDSNLTLRNLLCDRERHGPIRVLAFAVRLNHQIWRVDAWEELK
jgi:hypothetical protein